MTGRRRRRPARRDQSGRARDLPRIRALRPADAGPRSRRRITSSRTAAGSDHPAPPSSPGIMAAKGLLEGIVEHQSEDLLSLATELEGHPDNVAPALFGGLTIAWMTGAARSTRSSWCTVESRRWSSSRRRRCRPRSREACSRSRCRTRTRSSTSRVRRCSSPRSSNPRAPSGGNRGQAAPGYRAAAMPETDALLRLLREHGLPAVVSGAGPSILVLCSDPGPATGRCRSRRDDHDERLGVAHAGCRLQRCYSRTRTRLKLWHKQKLPR